MMRSSRGLSRALRVHWTERERPHVARRSTGTFLFAGGMVGQFGGARVWHPGESFRSEASYLAPERVPQVGGYSN